MTDQAEAAAVRCGHCRTPLREGAAFCHECGASTTPPPAGSPALPGFEILRTLGTGGAAEVYLAHQQSLDRLVAVKVLRQGVEGDDAAWRSFSREARTMARLSSHTNVVTLYTAGRADTGQPYLVTEYMDRGSLDDMIAAQGPLPPATVAAIGIGLADALIAAHALGIHHRDVKPGNVLLSHDGRAKLADFGIARLLSGRSVTTTDVFAFTPEHVAPEMLRHEPDGPWSDVYGLASTLATALIGAPPVRRLPDERIDAFLTRKLMAPPPTLAGVPPELSGPITRALDTDPTQRPEMSQFRDQLAAAAQRLGTTVPPQMPVAGLPGVLVAIPAVVPVAPAVASTNARVPGVVTARQQRGNGRVAWVTAIVLATLAAVVIAVLLSTRDDNGQQLTPVSTATSATTPASSVPSAVPSSVVPTETTGAVVAPETSPPVTVAASTSTLVTTTAPVAPTTVAATTTVPAAEPSGSLIPSEAESLLRDYYAQVAAGDYATSWSQLAPEFQSGKARSFEYYSEFWDENDIEVGEIELVESHAREAIVYVDLRWNDSNSWQTDEFTLRRDNGEWLIAGQTTVDA
jgi:hypothetical protein